MSRFAKSWERVDNANNALNGPTAFNIALIVAVGELRVGSIDGVIDTIS